MPEIPAEAITRAIEALNEAHTKRGWNKPQHWWAEEVATAILEAAAPILEQAWRRKMDQETLAAARTRARP